MGPCTNNPLCIEGHQNEPLLQNLRRGLIDPDTPEEAKTRQSHSGKTQKLVFSDEFNTAGRTFYDGDDPFFQAVDIWYGATQDLEVSYAVIATADPTLTSNSGTIPTQHTQKTATSFSNSTASHLMDSNIGQAWFSLGTSFATKVDTWRLPSHYLDEVM
jgi:hypothetical protein